MCKNLGVNTYLGGCLPLAIYGHYAVVGLPFKLPPIPVGFMLMQSAGSADIVVSHADTLTLAR